MNMDLETTRESIAFPYSIKRHGVTLRNCDDEPVQTPGCIQAHGMLAAVRLNDLIVLQVSANSLHWWGVEPEAVLGMPLSELLGDENARRLGDSARREAVACNPIYLFTLPLAGGRDGLLFDVSIHLSDAVLLVEFEPASTRDEPPTDYHGMVKRGTSRLQAAPNLAAFCKAAAEEVRTVTGLDRVMIYRFLPDESGQVFAEARKVDLHSWLGLRYPAEDIPKPAREIFKRIGIRPVPDVAADPVEMVPLLNPDTGLPLDMTHCALRGVSVMYSEYLKNMGVAASLTMPILRDGLLWGLIACHHQTPTSFPYQIRAAAEFLAQVVSLQLKNAEDREYLEYRRQTEATHLAILARAAQAGGLASLLEGSPSLLDGISCSGAAVYHRDRWWTAGKTPGEKDLEALVDWLRTAPELHADGSPVLATDALSSRFPAAARFTDVASGLLAVPLSQTHRSVILWFRPEQVQTFNWGGNPYEKPTNFGPSGPRLTPRKSFDLWQEQARGRSEPWNSAEIDAALKLRYLVMDLVVSRAEQLAALNDDLARSNEELDAFAYVASHDLKEPLRGIYKYAYYLMEEARAGRAMDERSKERIESLLRLTLRMDTLLDALLHFSRVGRLQLEYEDNPLAQIVREAVEMVGARMEESGAELHVPRALPTVQCDRVRAREIFSNLIGNAVKYNDKPRKWVEVGYVDPAEPPPGFYHPETAPPGAKEQRVFYVRDNGIGIAERHREQVFKIFKRLNARDAFGGGSGAGLTITRKLVERHQGQLWFESAVGEGSTFFFTLPCDDVIPGEGN